MTYRVHTSSYWTQSLRRARLGYLDYRLRGHANELKGMKPWSAEGALFLSVTVAAWKREWRSLSGGESLYHDHSIPRLELTIQHACAEVTGCMCARSAFMWLAPFADPEPLHFARWDR
jgi:hypothetical protein